jgi:hypothetical protein
MGRPPASRTVCRLLGASVPPIFTASSDDTLWQPTPYRMGVSPASGFPPNLLQKAELQFPEGPLEPGGPLRFEGPLIGSPRTFAGRPQSPICCIPGGPKLISAKAQARLCSELDYRSALGSNSWIGSTGLMAVMVCL